MVKDLAKEARMGHPPKKYRARLPHEVYSAGHPEYLNLESVASCADSVHSS
jgi:hypothetical protein